MSAPPGVVREVVDSLRLPVLGVLAVARDALTLDQIMRLSGIRAPRRDVARVVSRLRPLLDITGPRMRLATPVEVDEEHWHAQIALSYRDGAPSWSALDWPNVDRYGLKHLAAHLTHAPRPVADGIVDLVSPGLRRALIVAFGQPAGDREFTGIVNLAADYAVQRLPIAQALPAALFLGAVGRDAVPNTPPAVAALLARLGQLDEALDRLAALPPSTQRFQGLLGVLRNAPDERGDEVRALLVQAALAVPPDREPAGWSLRSRFAAIQDAAVALAPHDLELALRLCSMAEAPDTDAVYRAAGQESLVPRLRAGRAGALLDIADHAELSTDRLARVEAELSTEDRKGRIVGHARLAAHWRWLDTARARRHAEAVRAEAITVRGDTAWLTAVVDAAAALAPADPDAARWLLDRFDGMLVDGVSRRPILAAASLWARWGDAARSEFLLAALLEAAHGNDVGSAGHIAEAAAVVATFDRSVAVRLADETFRRVQRATAGDDRDRALRTMASALATFAPDQASAAARLISRRDWTPGGCDRATALAELAAAALDAGRNGDAKALLEECNAGIGTLSTVDQGALAADPAFVLAAGAPPVRGFSPDDPIYERVLERHRQWRARCAQMVLRTPADVVRAMVPEPAAEGSPYGWDRTLRTLIECAAQERLDGVLPLADRIADANERAVALAGIANASDPDTAARLRRLAVETLDKAPRYAWRIDIASVHPSLALAYLRPDVRARVELAFRGIDTGGFSEPFLRCAVWAATASSSSASSASSADEVAAVAAGWTPAPVPNLPNSDNDLLAAVILGRPNRAADADADDSDADGLAARFPALVTAQPQDAARLLLDAVRSQWREAMALLEWAAEPLVKQHGIELVEALDDAVSRARAFGH